MALRTAAAIRLVGLVIAAGLIAASAGTAYAGQMTLAWDPNTEPDLAGYKVSVGDSSRVYQSTFDVGNVTTYTVTGLLNGQVYYFAVTAYDSSGNESGFSAEVSTTVADTTAPVISGVAVPTKSASGTTITWTTNESSDSQVEYGVTTAYGSATAVNPTSVTAHTVTLSGLVENTLYHFRVRSRDAAGNLATSADFSFTTTEGTPPSTSITTPAAGATVSGTVTVGASATDNVGVMGVQFKLDGAPLGAEDTVAPYAVGWDTTTASDGPHSLTAVARDAAGNVGVSAAVSVTVANGIVRLSPQDTSLNVNATNYSTDTTLTTYTWPDNRVANAIVMKFDLAALPAGAVVQDATLHLALVQSDGAAESTYTVTAHKVVGKNPVIASATGYTFDGVTAWTPNTCCANNVPLAQADISPAYATRAVDKTLGDKTWTITTMVQDWVANPTTNVGLLLNSDATKLADRYRYFASMEHPDPSLRPFLRITYSIPPSDTTPPVISGVAASGITSSGATVSWTTNEASDSQVDYGATTAYGSATAVNASLVTAHSATLIGLANATLYHFRVRSRDTAGNLATSADFTFTTLDGTPPVVSITAPPAGATVSDTTTVTATATDNVGVASVQFLLDGANLGAADTTAPYAIAWDTRTVGNGLHTLTAVARDAAGNTKAAAGVSVTVANDTTAPVISSVAASGITTSAATIAWTTNEASDSQVEYGTTTAYGSATPINASLVTAHSAALTGLADTTLYHFRVRSRDAAGNLAASADFTFTTLDGTPPAVSITAPAAGAAVSSTTTVTATATDNVGVASVQFQLDGTNLGAVDTTAPYAIAWDTKTVGNGLHTLTAVARDAAGNAKTSAGVSVTVANDTTPPVISGVAASGLAASGAMIAWTTNETSDSQVDYGLTTAYGSASALNGSLVTSHTVALSGLVQNTLYHFRVRSRDAAGNLALSGDLTFTTLAADITAPTVLITAPTAGASVTGVVTATADASDDVGVVGVQFKLDGANLGAEVTTLPYAIDWDTTTVFGGAHTLTAVARDLAGHVTTSTPVSVSVANGIVRLSPQDTSLNVNATNYSSDTTLTTYTWPDNRVANAIVMKFDLAPLPAGAVVQDATLHLALVASDNAAESTYTMTAHKVVGKNAVIASATGYTFDGVTGWTPNACCANNVPLAQADISPAYATSAVDKALGDKAWTITAMVQEWLADPATNVGLLLNSDATKLADRYRYFASMEHPNPSLRPFLRIAYSLGPPPDTTPPSVSITAPAAGASLSGSATVAASATDNVGVAGVQFRLDGAPLGAEATAAPYAVDWNTTTASFGTHTLTAVARDAAGNATTSAAVTVTVANPIPDTTPPVISGVAASGITSSGATIGWTTDEASDSQIEYGTTTAYSSATAVDASLVTAHSVTLSGLLDATLFHFRVRSRDAAGNPATSPDSTFTTPDGTAPTVSISSPADGAGVSGTITVAAGATDNVGVASVQFRLDGANLGAKDTTAPYSVSWDTTKAAAGAHTLRAVAVDAAGNSKTSAAITVTVLDITPPVISAVTPSAITSSGATISWTTNEVSDSQVEYGTTTAYGSATAVNASLVTSHVVTLTGLADTTLHHFRVRSRDAAGNVATSADFTFTTLDGTPPAVSITAPAASATVSGTTTVTATATDNVGVASVQFQLDGTNLGAVDTTAPYAIAWDTKTVGNGLHTLTAVARDGAGNATTATGVGITVANDTTAPVIAGVTTSAITTSAAAIDWATDEASDSQVDYGLTTAYGSATAVNATLVTAHTVALSGLAKNSLYHFRVRSRDTAGNLAVSGDFAFTTLAADVTAPTVLITAPTAGASVTGVVIVTADASDDVGVVGVQFRLDGANLGAEVTTLPCAVDWDTTTVFDGPHTLTAVARDAAGNVGVSAAVSVTVANGVVRLSPQDTSLNVNATNYSTDTTLTTYTWPDYRIANAILMKFDVAALPAGAVVQDATLHLALVASDGAVESTYTVTAHKVVGRNPVIASATGYTADGVTGWTPNTCCSNNVPLAQADISPAYATVAVDKALGDKTWTITGMVQEWLADPMSNFGLLLNSDPSKPHDRYRYFASMEHPDLSLRPFLQLTYSVSSSPDGTAPVVSITLPSGGATVSGTATVAANASDDVGVISVQFNLDGTPLGAPVAAAPYAVDWDTTGVSDGAHTLTAVARDLAGHATTSSPVSVTVANGIVRLTPQDTSLNVNATNYSSDTTLTTYTWPDYRLANAILMTFDLAALPAGAVVQDATLHLALVQSDGAAESTYTVTAHKVVGKNPVIASATGYTVDGVTAWTPNTCCANNVPLAQADISPAYDTRAVDKALGNKTWTITAMVQDWVANPTTNVGLLLNSDATSLANRYRSFASVEHGDPRLRPFLEITYSSPPADETPPSVAISTPSTGASVSGTATVHAGATDDVGVVGVQFVLDGAPLGVEMAAAPYAIDWDTTSVSNGPHALTAVARDAAGNVGTSAGVTVTVANDTTPPLVTAVVASSITFSSATIGWTTNEASDSQVEYGLTTAYGSASVLDGSLVTAHVVPFSGLLGNSLYHFRVRSRDAAGNLTTSPDFTFTTLSVVVPATPTITGFAPSIGAPGTTVTIAGSNFDAIAANNQVRVNLASASVSASGTTSVTALVPAGGSGRISVTTSTGSATSAADFFIPPAPYTAADVDFTGRAGFTESKAVAIAAANHVGLVVFDATAGQRVSVKVAPGPSGKVSIHQPDGSVLASRVHGTLTALIEPQVVAVTGTYTIDVDPSNTAIGTTTVTPYNVPPDVTGAIAPDGATRTVTLDTPGQNASFAFNGTANQRISLKMSAGPSGAVSIRRPDGSTQASATIGASVGLIETVLSTTGTHQVVVDYSEANTGSVSLNLYDVPPDLTGTITPGGTPVILTFGTPGQNARLTFSGTAGQRVGLNVSSGPAGAVKILNPDESVLTSASIGVVATFVDTKTLAVTGTYAITVDPSAANTGSVTLTLYDVPPDVSGTVAIGDPAVGVTIGTPGQNALLTFSGTAGQQATVRVTNNTMLTVTVKLLKPDGTQLTSSTAVLTSFNLTTQTLPVTGTYTIVVDPNKWNTGAMNISVTSP